MPQGALRAIDARSWCLSAAFSGCCWARTRRVMTAAGTNSTQMVIATLERPARSGSAHQAQGHRRQRRMIASPKPVAYSHSRCPSDAREMAASSLARGTRRSAALYGLLNERAQHRLRPSPDTYHTGRYRSAVCPAVQQHGAGGHSQGCQHPTIMGSRLSVGRDGHKGWQ